MDRQAIIDLLEKTRRWILDEGGVVCPHKYGLCKHDNENCPVFCIDQALTLLKQPKCKTCGDTGFDPNKSTCQEQYVPDVPCPDCQQPPVGEWTKEIRSFVKMYDNEIPKRAEITFLKESCDIIDRAEAINKDLMQVLENALVSLVVISMQRLDNNVATDAEILKIMGDSFRVVLAKAKQ